MIVAPMPKRDSQRRRVNKPSTPTVKAPAGREVDRGAPACPQWHPIAQRWYEALGESGQAQFYEPSDWAEAYAAAEILSFVLCSPKGIPAMVYASWLSQSARLMTTEGDRRRLRIELDRAQAPDPGRSEDVSDLGAFRARAAGR